MQSRHIKGWQHDRGADNEVGPGPYGPCLLDVFRASLERLNITRRDLR